MTTNADDLFVAPISSALDGFTLDVVVSGSIGAVESVRFIRSLRRLGARVQPWLTEGGSLFTTATALAWAADCPARTSFDGSASHIARNDACIVAPCSASFLAKISQGITESPALALVASYLGQKKPVFCVPNMHDSLAESPFVTENLERVRNYVHVMEPRREEGKQKFPDPSTLADEISHLLCIKSPEHQILVTMGTTRGYIDDIRFISNYSSGALGSRLVEELYRHGFTPIVISGPCKYQPKSYGELLTIETYEEMYEAVNRAKERPIFGAIFAASVLDFVPSARQSGKIRSGDDLHVDFVKTEKIISLIPQELAFKVGFKLEAEITDTSRVIANDYLKRYHLSHLVMNAKTSVDEQEHQAQIYRAKDPNPIDISGKLEIARYLTAEAVSLMDQK